MIKKHIRLYIALFLVSMLISATFIVAYADTQQSTTITYTALSPEEKNHYTINIPANIEVNENGGSMKVSIEDGYEFESDYQVYVSLNENSFASYDSSVSGNIPSSEQTKLNVIKLYLNGDKNSPYYLGLSGSTGTGTPVNTFYKYIARFSAEGVSETYDGTLNLSRVNSSSTDKTYRRCEIFSVNLDLL